MKQLSISILALFLLFACGKTTYEVPAQFTATNDKVNIFPDYTNVVVPPNIAPLNFMPLDSAEAYVARLLCEGHELVASCGDDWKIQFDTLGWRQLLEASRGKKIEVTLFAKRSDAWTAYEPFGIEVANEPIDPYLSYRLIEPGYELYRQLGLYQRNLTNFDVHTIYENNRKYSMEENHCVNCHNYHHYSTKDMMFHVRGNMGCTLIAHDGKIEKLNLRSDSTLSAAVYPTWHPTQPWIVFSSNKTGQAFHILDHEKVEVVDYGSDLIFYDVENHKLSNILKTSADFENFPHWAPTGDRLYYCCAHLPEVAEMSDSARVDYVLSNYRNIRYNVMSMAFDPATRTFSEPELEIDCVAMGKSATVPRVSPDGRFLLVTLANFGQFHIWHRSSDQYVKNLETGEVYPLTEANSPDIDSYHCWSTNSRWFVFSSRRVDGSYTRPHIAYFDTEGHARKAFMLPQEDPESNFMLLKSYNVPELSRDAVSISEEEFRDAIYNQEAMSVTYAPLGNP